MMMPLYLVHNFGQPHIISTIDMRLVPGRIIFDDLVRLRFVHVSEFLLITSS